MHPRRGEVWWVAFDPSMGGEIQKTGSALIISNNAANAALNRVIVIPLTSQTSKVYPGEAMVTLNGEQRKAMGDQVMTASRQRLRTKLGSLDSTDMTAVENALLLSGAFVDRNRANLCPQSSLKPRSNTTHLISTDSRCSSAVGEPEC
jgi:mRNA interferase MazF